MAGKETAYPQTFTKTIVIHAGTLEVWKALTNPDLMKRWMSEEEINIITDWQVGKGIIIEGPQHWAPFENQGVVLQFLPGDLLQYSHLSSLSRLPDEAANYTVFEFRLLAMEKDTSLVLTLSNFPTESIYRHLVFYWSITLGILKKFIEEQQ